MNIFRIDIAIYTQWLKIYWDRLNCKVTILDSIISNGICGWVLE